MPSQETVNVSYWTLCWWGPFPYPCKKWRKESRWCYNFWVIKSSCYVFAEHLKACEGDAQYEWWSPCFGFWADATLEGRKKCFPGKLESTGNCSLGYQQTPH